MSPTEEDVENWKDQEGEVTDMAQAYRDLARGDEAATAIEAQLDTFHSQLDALLVALEGNQPDAAGSAARDDAASLASSNTAVASTAEFTPSSGSVAGSENNPGTAGESEPAAAQGAKQN